VGKFSWLIPRRGPDFWPGVAFKREPEGWIFKVPNRWIFGPPQYYLLNDAQKSEIEASLYPIWRRLGRITLSLVFLIAFLVVFMMVRAHLIFPDHPKVPDLIAFLWALFIGGLFNFELNRRFQPLLAGVTPTTKRISFVDQFVYELNATASRSHAPISLMVILALYFIATAAVRGFDAFTTDRWEMPDSMFSMMGVVFWGFGAAYFTALLIVKLKTKRFGA
jgi:hypothetical protein